MDVIPPLRRKSLAVVGLSLVAITASLSVDASSDVAANVVTNPGFENETVGWNTPLSDLRRTTGRGGDGYAAYLAAPQDGVAVLNDAPNNVTATRTGNTYNATAWVRTSAPPVTLTLRLREVLKGSYLGKTASTVTLDDSEWRPVTLSHTAVSTGGRLDLNVFTPTPMSPDGSFEVDDVSVAVEEVAAPPSPPLPPTPPAPSPPLPPPPPPADDKCTVDANLVPSCGALWGIYNTANGFPGGSTWTSSVTSMEDRVGRPFDIVKRYHDMSNHGGNGVFPDEHERTLAQGGRIPFIAWVSRVYSSGADFTWPDIAAGRYDESVIDPVARRLKEYGGKVFLDFDHEMDGRTHVDDGTPADYVRAYRHIVERFEAIGASNVVFVWTTTGYLGNEAKIIGSYPGDAYVDWVAYDPYNFAACNNTGWKSFSATVDTFYRWLMNHGHGDKPFMLGEYGTAPDPDDPMRRAEWFRGQVAGMKAHPNLKAVMYFNSRGICSAETTTSISRDEPALDAFSEVGHDPYFNVSH